MTVAIMQPYLFPYIGYFQLLHAADVFVLYDDVAFIKKGWINRNQLALKEGAWTFSLPIHQASQNKKIHELEIQDDSEWWHRLGKTLQQNFGKNPHFARGMGVVESIAQFPSRNLAEFVNHSVTTMARALGLTIPIYSSRQLEIRPDLKAEERILAICKHFKATHYVNSANGKELYSAENFKREGIQLQFLRLKEQTISASFPPFASTLELLVTTDTQAMKNCLGDYDLEGGL